MLALVFYSIIPVNVSGWVGGDGIGQALGGQGQRTILSGFFFPLKDLRSLHQFKIKVFDVSTSAHLRPAQGVRVRPGVRFQGARLEVGAG